MSEMDLEERWGKVCVFQQGRQMERNDVLPQLRRERFRTLPRCFRLRELPDNQRKPRSPYALPKILLMKKVHFVHACRHSKNSGIGDNRCPDTLFDQFFCHFLT